MECAHQRDVAALRSRAELGARRTEVIGGGGEALGYDGSVSLKTGAARQRGITYGAGS